MVREKIIDTALIVTLILVAFGITWTLLTLNRSGARGPSQPPETSRSAASSERRSGSETEIVPLPLGGDAEEEEQLEVAPRQGESERATAAQQTAARRATEQATERQDAAAREPNQAAVADPEPVPAGPVQLERIGFSFVTGGAGACGIVLEPWEHVAVSRELLAAYGCGAQVTITLDDEKGGRSQFEAVVGDTMNPIHSRTVNIYVGEDEPALEYGVTSGVLRP